MAAAILETRPSAEPSIQAAPPGKPAFYHPELDGLRFFAFLAVFFYHVFPLELPEVPPASPLVAEILTWIVSALKVGGLGVDLFFVLSAYLITELLVREWEAQGEIQIGAFYVRRALRIWPLYYAFLAFIWCCEPLVCAGSLSPQFAIPMAFFGGNWANVFLAARPASVATVLWSVSVEEQFYLVWPWVVRWLSPGRLLWACLAMIGIAAVTRAVLVANGCHHYVLYFNTLVRLDSLAAGALVALWLRGGALDLNAGQRLLLAAGAVVMLVCGMRWLRVEEPPAWAEFVTYPLWTLGSTILLVATLQPQGSATGPLAWSPLVYLGRISYGLYVLHFLAIAVVVGLGWCRPCTPTHAFYALAVTIALAAVSYQLLERPFLRLKDRFTVVPSGA